MNLLKSLTDQFGGQIVKGLVGNLGIGEKDAKSAMNGSLPSILGGLINKVGGNSGTDELFDIVRKDEYSGGGMLDNLGSLFGGGTNSSLLKTGAGLLPMLLGGKNQMGGILDIAGRVFGGGASRQRSVLSMLAPLVISFIGKSLKGSNNMSKTGLVDLLSGQKSYVKDAIHPEMASALGFADWKDDKRQVRKEEQVHTTEHQQEESSGGGMGFLKWLLPLLLFGLLGMFLMRSCGGNEVKQVETKKEPVKIEKTQPKAQPVKETKPAVKTPVKQNTKPTKPAANNQIKNKAQNATKNAQNAQNTQNTQNTQKPPVKKPPVRKGINNQAATKGASTANTTAAAATTTYTGEAKMFQDAAKAGRSTVVNFGTLSPDGKALSAPAKARLDQIANIMKATPNLKIDVRGHNKDQGNAIKNGTAKAASKVRAGLVQAYLITKGIKANRIASTSLGHNEPLAGVPATDDKQKRITIKTTK